MPYPVVSDDGRSIEIDLHGASVADAEFMLRRLVRMAAARGRSSIRVIHGASTSESGTGRITIRHRLHDLLETGELGSDVIDWVAFDTTTTLALAVTAVPDPARITIHDLV